MIAVLVALAAAESIRGTVVDPHQRAMADAAIVLACPEQTAVAVTDENGRFQIAIGAAGTCDVSVSRPGFETLTRTIVVPAATPVVFELSPARWEERVDVTAPALAPANAAIDALGGAAVTAEAMRVAGPDSARWVALAERSAGQPLGRRSLMVNGMAGSVLPPSGAITAINVGADPFSVEVGGADSVTIDVSSQPPRAWHADVSPGLVTSRQHDALLPAASFGTQHRAIGGGGPLTGSGTIRAQASGSMTVSRSRSPYVVHAADGDRLAVSDDTVDEAAVWSGAIAARLGTWDWQGSLLTSRSTTANGGIGGRSGLSGALDTATTTDRGQITWRRAGRLVVLRGGIAFDREHQDMRSKAVGAGYMFADTLVAGAPDTLAALHRRSAVSVRAVAASRDAPLRGWLGGVEAGAERVDESRAFNQAGLIFPAGPFEAGGTRLVRTGESAAGARTQRFAAFGQRIVAANRRVWARVGARAEWQRDYGTTVSPRFSIGVQAGRFLVGGNAGTFSDLWEASNQLERDFRMAAPGAIESPSGRLPLLFAGDGARRTDVVLRGSVMRLFRGGRIGVEQTVRTAAHLSGLTRRLDRQALIDVMDDNRSLIRRQTRARLDLAPRRWSASIFYEYTSSIDDTDGPFWMSAAGSADLERGPSSGVPAHAFTGVGAGAVRGVRLLVSGRVSSGTAYSFLTGNDPYGLFTFNERVGAARNAERTPPSADLSAYAARRVRLPLARLTLDLGVRLENLLGALAPLEIERSAVSALAGQPVRAARGRSISFWSSWEVGR